MLLVAVFCFFLFFFFFWKCQNLLLSLLMCLVSWRIVFHHAKACYIYGAVGNPREGPGGPAPLFLDQTEARRVEKNFFETAPVPLISGSGWLFPPPPPPFVWRSGVWKQFYAKVLSKCCKCTDVSLLTKKHWTDFAFITTHVQRVAGKPRTKASKAVYVNCFSLSLKTKRCSIPSKLEILFFLWSHSETRKGTFMRSWVIFNKQNQQRQRDDKGHGARRS